MALNQNLKAVITFGGNLDASWNRSTQGINKGIKDVEKQTQKLTKQQQTLASEIKKSKLAGKDISALKRDYSGVTKEIKKASAAQEALNRDLKRAEQFKRVQGLGKGAFAKAGNIAASMFPGGLALGGGGLIAGALGSLIAPAARNAQTAEKTGIAKSYGVGVETFNAWDSVGKQYGMNGENFGDLFEEYLHKAGEYKQNGKQGGLQDAFETLGFKAGDLAGLSDIDQFSKIVERALTLKDQSKASFALDSLFGGEASKMLMLLKQSGKSYRDLMDEQKRYQLVTEEGARGAVEGNRAVSNLQTVLSSAMDEISGQLGGQLSPQIKSLTDNLAEWFKNGGISKIVNFMKNELYPGVLTFGNGVVFVGKIIYAAAKKLSWMLPDENESKTDVLTAIGSGMPMEVAKIKAEGDGLGEWFAQNVNKPGMEKSLRDQWSGSQSKLGAIPLFWDKDQEGKERQQLLESVDGKSSDGPFSFDWATEMSKNTPKSDPSTGTTPVEKGLGLTFPSPDVGRGTPLPEQTQGLQFSLPPTVLPDAVQRVNYTDPNTTFPDAIQFVNDSGLNSPRPDLLPHTPDAPLLPREPQTHSNDKAEPSGTLDPESASSWPTLIQQIERVDTDQKPTAITDSRRQELHIEINVSNEQEGSAIADEVINKAQATDIFNGNNAMYDNGGLW